jgi:hypothetical protein
LGAQVLLDRRRGALAAPLVALGFALLGGTLYWAGEPSAWVANLPAVLSERFQVSLETVRGLLSDDELARAALRVRAAGLALAGFAGLAVIGTLESRRPRTPSRAAPAWLLLFALAGAEGAWYARVHLSPRAIGPSILPHSPAMEALRAAVGDGRLLRLDESDSGVSEVLQLARPNLPMAYGIADLSPYVVFTPRRSVELWTAVDPRARWRSGLSRISSLKWIEHPALDVLRVSALLSSRALEHPRLEPVFEAEGFFVYRRTQVPARARWLTTSIAAPPLADPLALIAAGLSDPARQTVLPAGTAAWPCDSDAPSAQVRIESERPGRIVVRADGAGSGWLLLADAWYPGWRATVDGRVAPIVAVDHALRGVALTAGEHRVEFEYVPFSLRLGLALSLLCAAALWMLNRSTRRGLALS